MVLPKTRTIPVDEVIEEQVREGVELQRSAEKKIFFGGVTNSLGLKGRYFWLRSQMFVDVLREEILAFLY